ncbi:neutral zinc metallopeptidase [Herbidospora sp. RD11066]
MRSRLRVIPALLLVLASIGFGARPASAADDVRDDIRAALSVTRAFWADHWYDYFNVRYVPPRILGGYNGRSANRPICGGQRATPLNAFYCGGNAHYITWDVNLMSEGYKYGDGWIYHVIAHEWGHAVQAHVPWLRAVQDELQADCLAGAALAGAARDGNLVWERGDTAEVHTILRLLSGDTPWTKVGDYGSAAERMRAFRLGANRGVPACFS